MTTSELTIRLKGKQLKVVVGEDASVLVNGKKHSVEILKSQGSVMTLSIDGRIVTASSKTLEGDSDGSGPAARLVIAARGKDFEVEIDDERSRIIKTFRPAGAPKGGKTRIKAPMPGMVVRLEVQVGQEVKAGQGLVVLEAMKMENEIRSQTEGIVDTIAVNPGSAVEKDALLLTLRALETK